METQDKNYAEQIDATVETISKHVEKKSGTGLTTTINKWITVLESEKGYKNIANNLTKLKQAIDDKETEKAVELMAKLGEQTTDAAEKAEKNEAAKIKALGKSLTAASKAIAKFM